MRISDPKDQNWFEITEGWLMIPPSQELWNIQKVMVSFQSIDIFDIPVTELWCMRYQFPLDHWVRALEAPFLCLETQKLLK